MPYSNNGGPWGGGGKGGGGDDDDDDRRQPQNNGPQQVPDIDEMIRKGQEKLKVVFGGGGGGGGQGGQSQGPMIGKGGVVLAGLAAVGLWLFASFYSVKPEEQSVELFLGKFSDIGQPGLNFPPWPFVTAEILPVTREHTEDIGVAGSGSRQSEGLMLTGDENIVDIDFQVVWNIDDARRFLFELENPQETIRAVSESAMREVIGRSNLAPILNRDRDAISIEVRELIQSTLDSYKSGVHIVRLNFDKADPPRQVIDAFRDVQAAEQERDTLEKQADAYANRKLAEARGQAAELQQQAEGYRAQVVNQAEGEAARFVSVYTEYALAPDVTRTRLYLETMERVLGGVNKIIIDEGAAGGQGVVPYLPLDQLRSGGSSQ